MALYLGDTKLTSSTVPTVLTAVEYAALESPPGSGKYPSLAGKRVIIKDVDTELTAFQMAVPDYAKQETDSKFSSAKADFGNYVWTVNRSGYVILTHNLGETVEANLNNYYVNIFYNVSGNQIAFFQNTFLRRVLIPVNVGDIVNISVDSSKSWPEFTAACYFIPPRFVTTKAPNIVTSGASYSTNEVATGETWIDGKPIYRRVFEGTLTGAPDTLTDTNLIATDIRELIRYGGWCVSKTNDTYYLSVPFSMIRPDESERFCCMYWDTSGLRLHTKSAYDRVDSPYRVWAEYTKTTD
jgi:hypothetical protein